MQLLFIEWLLCAVTASNARDKLVNKLTKIVSKQILHIAYTQIVPCSQVIKSMSYIY